MMMSLHDDVLEYKHVENELVSSWKQPTPIHTYQDSECLKKPYKNEKLDNGVIV